MRISNKKGHRIQLIIASVALLFFIAASLFYLYKYLLGNAVDPNDHRTTTQKLGGGSISSPKESSKDNSGQPAEPTSNSSLIPQKPSGTFVSNHRPNLSGSPAPNTITSTCTSTPGALCTIEFRNGSIVRSLPGKTADANGNVSWNWKLQDIELAEGTWKIVAIASIGTNTAKEPDVLDLVILE